MLSSKDIVDIDTLISLVRGESPKENDLFDDETPVNTPTPAQVSHESIDPLPQSAAASQASFNRSVLNVMVALVQQMASIETRLTSVEGICSLTSASNRLMAQETSVTASGIPPEVEQLVAQIYQLNMKLDELTTEQTKIRSQLAGDQKDATKTSQTGASIDWTKEALTSLRRDVTEMATKIEKLEKIPQQQLPPPRPDVDGRLASMTKVAADVQQFFQQQNSKNQSDAVRTEQFAERIGAMGGAVSELQHRIYQLELAMPGLIRGLSHSQPKAEA